MAQRARRRGDPSIARTNLSPKERCKTGLFNGTGRKGASNLQERLFPRARVTRVHTPCGTDESDYFSFFLLCHFFDRSRKTFSPCGCRGEEEAYYGRKTTAGVGFHLLSHRYFSVSSPPPPSLTLRRRALRSVSFFISTRAFVGHEGPARTNYTEIFVRGQSGRLVDSQVN